VLLFEAFFSAPEKKETPLAREPASAMARAD
jgi:hypothetical protein